jgi:peptidyl-prolyl cis-trans isomerase B (cyclophilin B)
MKQLQERRYPTLCPFARWNFALDSLGEPGYCVFGRVIEGMDVVDEICKVKTGAKGIFQSDRPLEDVVIKSAKRAK